MSAIIMCLTSVYYAQFIVFIISVSLLMFGLRFTDGDIKRIMTIYVLTQIFVLISLPLLLSMTHGACVG